MDEKELTQAEKRELLERIRVLTEAGVLNRDDRNDIYFVCIAACDREMAKMKEENHGI